MSRAIAIVNQPQRIKCYRFIPRLHSLYIDAAVNITASSSDQIVSVGSQPTRFTCKTAVKNTEWDWRIKLPDAGTAFLDYSSKKAELQERGIRVDSEMGTSSTLLVNATVENNNTEVYCMATVGLKNDQGDVATLLIYNFGE